MGQVSKMVDVVGQLKALNEQGLGRKSVGVVHDLLLVLSRLQDGDWTEYQDIFEGIPQDSKDHLCKLNSREQWWFGRASTGKGKGTFKTAKLAAPGRKLLAKINAIRVV